jgi:AcrR family transcriptional regulator
MGKTGDISTKEALLNCAVGLFKEYGYDNVSINQICKTFGVSKTTFYYYYKSKDELISDLFSPANVISNETIVSILSAEDHINQLWLVMELYINYFTRAGVSMLKELYKTNLKINIVPHSPWKIYLRDVMITLMRRAQEAGQIKNPAPVEELYESLIYLLDGINIIWAMSDGTFDVLAECRKNFNILLLSS